MSTQVLIEDYLDGSHTSALASKYLYMKSIFDIQRPKSCRTKYLVLACWTSDLDIRILGTSKLKLDGLKTRPLIIIIITNSYIAHFTINPTMRFTLVL